MNGEALWELQQIDTALHQLRRRLTKLPEAEAFAEAERKLAEHRGAMDAARKQLSEAESTIETIEHESEVLTSKRTRLEQQLKIVTETRQADALNHEIEALNAHRNELDDRELEAMEQQSDAEQRLAELAGDDDTVVAMMEAASGQLDVAKGAGADEEAEMTAKYEAARSLLTSEERDLYDSRRARHDGIGIAKLQGLRCDGCHLDLSRAEVDQLKALPADELADCPQCGRVLVR
ncbi:MAG TPA: C4-type zinc ribbon domain-containing protein [Ilumatobacteraceae bacterium]|nr:C4-type zinc ribbon domain-containing protein [Ilumatobacteraceae bacterium]